MSKVWDIILAELDPRVVAEKIDQPHDAALFSYRPERAIPQSYIEFRQEVGRYYCHHYAATIGRGYSDPPEVAESAAMDVLRSASGNRGGVEYFYNAAQHSMERGIYASFEAIATFLKETRRRQHIQWMIDTHISPLDFDKKVEVVRGLLRTYPAPGGNENLKRPEDLASNHYALLQELLQRWKVYILTKSRVPS